MHVSLSLSLCTCVSVAMSGQHKVLDKIAYELIDNCLAQMQDLIGLSVCAFVCVRVRLRVCLAHS